MSINIIIYISTNPHAVSYKVETTTGPDVLETLTHRPHGNFGHDGDKVSLPISIVKKIPILCTQRKRYIYYIIILSSRVNRIVCADTASMRSADCPPIRIISKI